MKRLEIGDEVYVRCAVTGNIYSCEYAGYSRFVHRHIAVPNNNNPLNHNFDISKGSQNKLVYPFPCVKELAK